MEDYDQLREETESRIVFCKDCVYVFVVGNKHDMQNWSCRNPKTYRYNVIDGTKTMRLCVDIRDGNLCEHFRSKNASNND